MGREFVCLFQEIRSRSFRRKRSPYARTVNTLIFQLWFPHYRICVSKPNFMEKVLIDIPKCQLDEKGYERVFLREHLLWINDTLLKQL